MIEVTSCFPLDSKLQIGIVTHQKLHYLINEGYVDTLVGHKFYRAVRSFFERAVEYSLENFSLDDELLKMHPLPTLKRDLNLIHCKLNIL